MLSLSVMLNKKQLSTIETVGEFGIYSDKPKLLKSNAGVCHVYWGEFTTSIDMSAELKI